MKPIQILSRFLYICLQCNINVQLRSAHRFSEQLILCCCFPGITRLILTTPASYVYTYRIPQVKNMLRILISDTEVC